ncbi:MAG: hypothetical protein QXI60_03605 [Thermofilaceae archaeon]
MRGMTHFLGLQTLVRSLWAVTLLSNSLAAFAQLNLPYSGSGNSSATLFRITQNGTGGVAAFFLTNSSATDPALFVQTTASGPAIFGKSLATSGFTYGARFEASGPLARGVLGYALSSTGAAYGVYGLSDSVAGTGVFGWVRATSGATYGVYGRSDSPSGFGVYGRATAASGVNYGVYGRSDSPSGYGGYFIGRGYFSGNVGIGTTTPMYQLDVVGDVRWSGTLRGGAVPWALVSGAPNFLTGVATTARFTGNGTSDSPLELAQQGATTGQVLKWNGSAWSPGTDETGTCIWAARESNIYNTNSGNVGIGTDTFDDPQAKLVVAGKIRANSLRIENGAQENKVLTCISPSGDAEWRDLPSSVTSITVTSPLTASSSTGDVTLSFDTNWSDGRYLRGVATDPPLQGSGSSSDRLRIAPGTTVGQVLRWDGSQWRAGEVQPTVYTQAPIEGTGSSSDRIRLTRGTASGQVLRWSGNQWEAGPDRLTLPYETSIYHTSGTSFSAVFAVGNTAYSSHAFLGCRLSIGSTGVYGLSDDTNGNGVVGICHRGSIAAGVFGQSSSGYAGYFNGRVRVTGNLEKPGGGFLIDHPEDPENKYLWHSFVESPDMKNLYDGVATTDAQGFAIIQLPDYFETLNMEYRYQLTVIDDSNDFVLAKVVREIANNQFVIRTSKPFVKVCWQVTGIRKDPWAEKNRLPAVIEKQPWERGRYLNPELYGQPPERGLKYVPETMTLPSSAYQPSTQNFVHKLERGGEKR